MPPRKKTSSNVTPIRRGKKKCPQCGLTGKHNPNCKHAFQPSETPLVLDGSTGAVITVDGKDAKIDTRVQRVPRQIPLVEVALEELVHDYNKLSKIRDEAASKAGFWRGEVKQLKDRIDPILAEIRRRDDEAHGIEPSEQSLALSETEDEDDEE